jgi:AMMECR1 domain-containing protein
MNAETEICTIEQSGTTRYPYSARAQILSLAQYALTGFFAGKTSSELQETADRLGIPSADRVNVTLRHKGRIRGSMSASGLTLGRQIVDAVYRAALDRRLGGPLTRSEMPAAELEVWIQIAALEIAPDIRTKDDAFLLGIEGLEINFEGKSAYYKPSVAITSRNKTAIKLFEALCKKAGLEREAWQRSEVSVRRTQWIYIHNLDKILSPGPALDTNNKAAVTLNTWIEESVSYLIRNQYVDGSTAYLYDPITDVFTGSNAHNVRAAGCLFALSQVLQSDHFVPREDTIKSGILQMARGLLSLTFLTNDQKRVVQEEDANAAPKVGATALLAAALSDGILRDCFAAEYRQLYRSVSSAQKTDGRFMTRFWLVEEEDRETNFFSGQALLVLALEAGRGNSQALDQCRLAFHPYVLHFRTSPATAFIGWHVDVWSRIARITGESAFANFAFEQTDWLLRMQLRNHCNVSWLGGFSQAGGIPKFSSIVFLEATARALQLAVTVGDSERITKYAESVRLGVQFCRSLRLEDTLPSLLADRARCRGGIALGPLDRRVRCDVVQHFITLCLALDQIKEYIL